MSIQKSFSSLTRGIYDDCAYKRSLHESTSPLLYNINPIAYESCTKCHMAYPGFIGALGGQGFGIGPDRVDIDSDLRGQTRLLTKCPSHKYDPTSYKYCGSCGNCDQGLPCGCSHCRTKDVSGLKDCRPGIIPIESLDTRAFDSCNPQKNAYIDRFDYLCANPQDPTRIFNSPSSRTRLGNSTRNEIKDQCSRCIGNRPALPDMDDCRAGGMGCRNNSQFDRNIYY